MCGMQSLCLAFQGSRQLIIQDIIQVLNGSVVQALVLSSELHRVVPLQVWNGFLVYGDRVSLMTNKKSCGHEGNRNRNSNYGHSDGIL